MFDKKSVDIDFLGRQIQIWKLKFEKNLVEFLPFNWLKCDFTKKKAAILVEAKLAILAIFNCETRGKSIWRIKAIRTLQFHLKLSKQSFSCPALKVGSKGFQSTVMIYSGDI